MSASDNNHRPIIPINSEQSDHQRRNLMSATTDQQQRYRNTSKRTKEGDDSFEREHRGSNVPHNYFNIGSSDQSGSWSQPPRSQQQKGGATRPSFPPFRLTFENNQKPSELSILKDLNRHCHISLSYGRYSSFEKKNHFLLYANSTEQFERLMDRNTWPLKICDLDFVLNIPSKVPTSFSIVVLGIPAQWDTNDLGTEIKKQYSTILKVERLYIKGGIPISKVRIDFASNRELSGILKNKRILLDEENTSYPIQPYAPPMKILRCYNCQQYNDHVAANCPRKDTPVCFRCGQNHPFNPNCQNEVCCAHCKGDHLSGSPNCQVKIEERRKRIVAAQPLNRVQRQQPNAPPSAWNKDTSYPAAPTSLFYRTAAHTDLNSSSSNAELSKKIDLLLSKVDELATEQSRSTNNMEILLQNYNSCRDELNTIKCFLRETISPYLCELSETVLGKSKPTEKIKLRTAYQGLKDTLQAHAKINSNNIQSIVSSRTSSPNESPSQAV
jgi:hypothetical protein